MGGGKSTGTIVFIKHHFHKATTKPVAFYVSTPILTGASSNKMVKSIPELPVVLFTSACCIGLLKQADQGFPLNRKLFTSKLPRFFYTEIIKNFLNRHSIVHLSTGLIDLYTNERDSFYYVYVQMLQRQALQLLNAVCFG